MITDIHELIQAVELTNVETIRVCAERKPGALGPTPGGGEFSADFDISVNRDTEGFEIRCTAGVDLVASNIEATIGAFYAHEEGLELGQEAFDEFVAKVGFMTLYPFLRSAVWDLCGKIGERQVTLPMITADQVEQQMLAAKHPELT